jgi:6-phosphogluconate dehydrogenase
VELILDSAGQKGTGKWTSQAALDTGTPAPTIAEAVFARCLSAIKAQRVEAAKTLRGPSAVYSGDKKEFIAAVHDALYASKICSYAQGFALMREAAKEWGWDLHFGPIALMWRGGCIIRARFLDSIKAAFDARPDLPNLLLAPFFREAVEKAQPGWRKVVSSAALLGIPAPAFSSALAYYDGYRSADLPANLLQAQRDYFGAHTYLRKDRPGEGPFHTEWLAV